MKIYNEDNTRLIEVINGLKNGYAINQTFRNNHYEFYKENNNLLIRIDSETIGHIEKTPYGTYEELRFENWNDEKVLTVEWLDEIDAHIFNYEV